MRMKILLTILMLAMLPRLCVSQEVSIPVAVLNFEISGLDSVTPVVLTNRFRAELLKNAVFNVLERDRMEEILQEQGFQQTGICNSDACIVEAGRILGVSSMIGGVVGRIGSLYSVSVRLIEVETGRIQYMVTEDYDGGVEDLVKLTIPKIAEKFSNKALKHAESLSGYGSLKIMSDPKGARIYVDGSVASALTPCTIDSIEAGVHVIRLQKDMLYASKAVFVAPDEIMDINLQLTLSRGALKIITEPSGADIYIDFEQAGRSPKLMTEQPVGSYFLKLMKDGYVDHNQIVTINERETSLITVKMLQMSYLTVASDPMDCDVFLDDSLVGRSPIVQSKILPGFHKLRLSRKGYVDNVQTLSFPAGKESVFNVTLDAVAMLNVNTDPPGAEIYIDGVYRGVSPILVHDLPPGVAELKVKKSLYEDIVIAVQLDKGMTKNFREKLIRKKGALKIISIPSRALIEIDGQYRGETPYETDEIDFGRHMIRLTKKGYTDIEKEIEIVDKLPKSISANFEIADGKIFVNASPKDAIIYLDNKRIDGSTAKGIPLLPGTYYIRAERAGYEAYTAKAVIQAQEAHMLKIEMARKTTRKAMMRSALFPGWGQRYSEKYTRQHLFMVSELISLSGIIISDIVYDSKISDYKDVREKYQNALLQFDIDRYRAKMNDKYSEVKKAKDMRQKFIIASAGIWALNLLDSAIFEPVYPVVQSNGLGIKLSFSF